MRFWNCSSSSRAEARSFASRFESGSSRRNSDGSLQTFAVALRYLKFFDPTTEKRTAPRSIAS